MSHKFRFSKDSWERLKNFAIGEEPRKLEEEPETQEPPVEEAPEKNDKRSKKEKTIRLGKTEAPKAPELPKGEVPQVAPGIAAALRTDVGCVRRTNQDALIEAPACGLWGVCDGMGGHKGGETASAGARDCLQEQLQGKVPCEQTMRDAVIRANGKLYYQQQQDDSLTGMGTTLSALWFDKKNVYIGQVGDSRAYRLRDGKLEQITNDHSVVAELVRSGLLTKEQAAVHPMRNVITRAVGTEEDVLVDTFTKERKAGDKWLVCSDGLYGMVEDDVIERMLRDMDIDAAADALLKAALDNGGRDNVSLVILLDKEGKA